MDLFWRFYGQKTDFGHNHICAIISFRVFHQSVITKIPTPPRSIKVNDIKSQFRKNHWALRVAPPLDAHVQRAAHP